MSENKGGESDDERYKAKTPALDDNKLQNYDLRKTKIADMLAEVPQEEALADASSPVREVMQVTYGVKYEENLNEGGKINCTMGGLSVYESPMRKTMRLDELEAKQKKERGAVIENYIQSQGYPGNVLSIDGKDSINQSPGSAR